MLISDGNVTATQSRSILLNDIPSESIFRGTLMFWGKPVSGVFLKTNNDQSPNGWVVVGLTPQIPKLGFPVFINCIMCNDYRPQTSAVITTKE